MINEDEVKNRITNNLVFYRKKAGLTQLEAANRLSYSDKAISKWERGLGLPDVVVLAQIADIYGTTLSDLVGSDHKDTEEKPSKEAEEEAKLIAKKHLLISGLSVGLVWLLAAIFFVIFTFIFKAQGAWYLFFIYAIPTSLIVALVFNIMWGKSFFNTLYESLLGWALAFAIIITIFPTFNYPYIWYLLLIPLTFQALVILWNNLLNTGRIFQSKHNKNADEPKK